MLKTYYFHWPSLGYARNWYEAHNKQEAREQIREEYGFKRLPNGFCIWEAR
jgi:hypothetical protein